MCPRAVSRARRGAPLGPLVAERALASTSAEFEVPPRHRYVGSVEDHRLTRGPVRGVSRTSAPVLARLPNPDLAGCPEARLAGPHPRASLCAGGHLYSAPRHEASAGTVLAPVPASCGPLGPGFMRDPGCGLRRTPLPKLFGKSSRVSNWDSEDALRGRRRLDRSLLGAKDPRLRSLQLFSKPFLHALR